MPYVLTSTARLMDIREQEYAKGAEIRCSKFTSCIGVFARDGTQVTGVHLVIFGKTGAGSDVIPFDNAAADLTVSKLVDYSQVAVIGQIPFWLGSVPAPYRYLLGKLRSPRQIETDDGIYGARVNGGVFQYWDQPDGKPGQYKNVF